MDYTIGIDLGGTFIKVALVASDGTILQSRRLPTTPGSDPHAVFAGLASALEEMSAAGRLPFPPSGGCGIGVPGVVECRTGRLLLSGPLAWNDVDLAGIGRSAIGCEVFVDIDVNTGALADLYFGCARDSHDMLYISWGTGIGAGFVVARKLYHSRGGAMGNFGHMPADPSSGRLCYCGCRGCLEIEAGGKAMCEQARARLQQGEVSLLRDCEVTPEVMAQAAASGDALARAVLERSAVLMARALAGILSFLNPDTVVFGGGVSQCFPVIQDSFDRELRLRAPNFSLPLTRVAQSTFGEHAGVVGAAMLPLDRMSPGAWIP
jgi:glucokinase